MTKPTQTRGTTAKQDAQPATQKTPAPDRRNNQDQPNRYANVAAFNRRKVLEVAQSFEFGDLSEVERCDLRYTLLEVAADLQALEQYCEQSANEITSMRTKEYGQNKAQ